MKYRRYIFICKMNLSFEETRGKNCPLISPSVSIPYTATEETRLATMLCLVINCIIWPTGLSANVLVFITVLRKPLLRTVYNTSVLYLMAADLCVIVLTQTTNIAYLVNKILTDDYSCSLFFVYNLFTWWCHGLSFFTLLIISIERYFAILHPFKYEVSVTKTRVSCVVLISWMLWSIVVLNLHLIPYVSHTTRLIIFASLVLPSSISTLVIYFKIYREIRANIVHIDLPGNTPPLINHDHKSSKTIGLIIGAQIASFLPGICLNIVQAFSLIQEDLLIHGIFPFAETAALMNALLDPVIYFWRSRDACRSIKELCCNCLVVKPNVRSLQTHKNSTFAKIELIDKSFLKSLTVNEIISHTETIN